MKFIILLFIISFNIFADHNVFHSDENVMIVPIIEVIDRDTIRTSISLPVPLNKISIRISSIDSPENSWRAKCPKEKTLGLEAGEFLKTYLKPYRYMILKNFKYGTWAGRIVSDIEVNGVDIATLLVSKGYAAWHLGAYKKENKFDWCKPI